MSDFTFLFLAGGSSQRFDMQVKKQWIRLDRDPLWLFLAKKIALGFNFKNILISANKKYISYMKNFTNDFLIVEGGASRQESLENALEFIDSKYLIVSDIARPCFDLNIINNLIANKDKADCIVPFIALDDTTVYEEQTINRENLKRIQTPQLSKTKVLKEALKKADGKIFTDESSLIKAHLGTRYFIDGDIRALKLTRKQDLKNLSCLLKPSNDTFVGNGFDVHRFTEDKNRKMYLAGVLIETKLSFLAHSDGDVAIHSLIDALLGACGAGDIGELFPDNDDKYKNINSKLLLEEVVLFIKEIGYSIVNVDLSIIAEIPKISKYKKEMRKTIASLLGIEDIFVNIKATTTEESGFIGRKEGVAVFSTASLKFYDWSS